MLASSKAIRESENKAFVFDYSTLAGVDVHSRGLVASGTPALYAGGDATWWSKSAWYYDNAASYTLVNHLNYMLEGIILDQPFRIGG